MEYDREFTRRTLSAKLTYKFGRDELTYTRKDRFGELQFPVRYDAINVLAPYKLALRDPSVYLVGVAVGFVFMGVSAAFRFGSVATLFGLLAFAAWIVSLAVGALGIFRVRNTMFQMASPPPGARNHGIRVMEGEHHDEIIAEIKSRWRDQLRRMHLVVNLSNDPKNEIAKFGWLRERGVISGEEYDAALRELSPDAPARELESTAANIRLN